MFNQEFASGFIYGVFVSVLLSAGSILIYHAFYN